MIVANLIPDGERRGVPDDPGQLLTAFPDGLADPGGRTTPHARQRRSRRVAAEVTMLGLVAGGAAIRTPLGDDALWKPT